MKKEKMNGSMKYLILVFGAFAIFFTGYPHIWSIYQPYAIELTGWTQGQASMCFYLSFVTFVLGNIVGGRIQDKYNPKIAIVTGGAIFTAIMAIGIVFVVLGFYGSPIAWVRYAPQKKYARIIDAIKREGFRDTTEIANHLSMQPNEVIDAVRVCIDKQYLCDYTIEDTKILPLNNRPDDIGTYTVQCPYCGGITQTSNNLQVKCDYCGRMIDVKKK